MDDAVPYFSSAHYFNALSSLTQLLFSQEGRGGFTDVPSPSSLSVS